MTEHNASKLSERQEILLSKFYDGEVSLLEKLRARLLIKRNSAASEFLASLEKLTSTAYSSNFSAAEPCDLWDRISTRIDAEERAAVYLGKRSGTTTAAHEGLVARLLSSHALFGGLSGAAVAAAILTAVYPASNQSDIAVINAGTSTVARTSQGFHTVTLPSDKDQSGAHTTQRGVRSLSAMEMDWMRGSGPLKIIQNPGSSSGVIWIKRQRSARASASPIPTPLLRKSSAPRKGVDEQAPRRSE
jgi:hypothetical protein